jgi:hypothetical protein
MRGYGAPLSPSESVTGNLTNPDWGWGDPTPDVQWTEYTLDYGYGSAHDSTAPAYLRADYTRVADDGGYLLLINGVWPRLGASARQRPTGFYVYVVDAQNNEHPCYSGRAGQGNVCSTDYLGRVLSAYTPQLAVGAYTVRVKWNGQQADVGTLNVYRRTRTEEEYALRSAITSAMDTGPKAIQYDSLLTSSAPTADQEEHTNLSTILRAWGQSLAELKATGVVTKLTQDLAPSDTTINVESTLGMGTSGAVRIGTTVLQYSGATSTTLLGVTRLYGQTLTLSQGTQVTHDSHVIAD